MQKLLTWLTVTQIAVSAPTIAIPVDPPPNWLDVPIENIATIPSQQVIRIDRSQRRVYLIGIAGIIASYPVAIGKKGWETPLGHWQIREKIANPAWTNFITRKVVPPGKKNPMGSRWISFWTDGKDEIGFHGTQDLNSIGKAASHGCVRMKEADVRDLFDRVDVGTEVIVSN